LQILNNKRAFARFILYAYNKSKNNEKEITLMSNRDQIIKYTLVPKNDEENYDNNFKLSLTEFAKALDGKVLVAPLIIYNSDLDIPLDMDESLTEYITYTDKDNLLNVIKRQETIDVFRTLVIHGFDISLDEIREIYCPLARKNEANICINTIKEIDLDNNLTFYLYDDLDEASDEEWEETKLQLEQDMKDYIDEYKNFEKMDEDELVNLLPFFLDEIKDYDDDEVLGDSLMDIIDNAIKHKEKKEQEEQKSSVPVPINKNKEEEKEENKNMISLSYDDGKAFIALNKLGDDLYTIEDDEGEVLLNADQIDFIMYAYNRIKDKPVQ
jgi:hypothetical protein